MLNSYTASSYSPNTDLSCHLLHTPFTSHWTLLPLAPSDLPSALSPSNSQQLSGHLHFRRFTAPRIQNGSQQVHKSSSTLLCSPHPPAPHAHTNHMHASTTTSSMQPNVCSEPSSFSPVFLLNI